MPRGDAPGEWYSPTQPIPLDSHGKPFAYDVQGVNVDDLIDFTPELRKEALKILEDYAYGPMFFPVVVGGQGRGAGEKGSIHMPGTDGGTNWPGAALDPETNTLYVPSAHTGGGEVGAAARGFRYRFGARRLPMASRPSGLAAL